MTAPRNSFEVGALVGSGAMIVFLSGLCTAGVGVWTLPAVMLGSRSDLYALMLLVPSMLGGTVFIAAGAGLFWMGHDALRARRRDAEAAVLARIGLLATIWISGLFGTVWLALVTRLGFLAVRDGHGIDGAVTLLLIGGVLSGIPVWWSVLRLRRLPTRPNGEP